MLQYCEQRFPYEKAKASALDKNYGQVVAMQPVVPVCYCERRASSTTGARFWTVAAAVTSGHKAEWHTYKHLLLIRVHWYYTA